MSFRPMLRPGQGFKTFRVLRSESGLSEKGRPYTNALKPQGEIVGILSENRQTEAEQRRGLVHPISHTIIQRGTQTRAKPTDVLELTGTDRRFLVHKVRDPGELGHFTVYHVEERLDQQ